MPRFLHENVHNVNYASRQLFELRKTQAFVDGQNETSRLLARIARA